MTEGEPILEGVTEYKESRLYKTYPELYTAIFNDKRNVFISGPGGVGKSYALHMITEEADRLSINYGLTSTTGVSAHAIKGKTIHSWASIGLGDKPVDIIIKKMRKNPEKIQKWKWVQLLIIDEISLLGSNIITLLDRVAKQTRYGKEYKRMLSGDNIEKIDPFAGIQMIFSGDVLQLPPINDEYCFKSKVWEQLNLFYFRMVYPYRYPDIEHFEMLTRIRVQEQTKADIEKLQTRVDAYQKYLVLEKQGRIGLIKPTRIYPRKNDVKHINMTELEKLEGDTYLYEATDTLTPKMTKQGKPVIEMSEINRTDYIQYLDNLIEPELYLKNNAQVMLTRNLDVESGLTNGSRGIIVECMDDRVKVLFLNGQEIDIIPYTYEYDDDKILATRHQIPLILASAIVCHKCQGSTLDYCIIDLGTSLFAPSMGYVALSRCRKLEGIFIVNLMPEKLKADPEALKFEKEIMDKSVKARCITD